VVHVGLEKIRVPFVQLGIFCFLLRFTFLQSRR
jgi:hypothetical protein